ncbi:hypothetical protein, partial [Streptococcus uberis]|uniref:hypothetical protein n=1 Tax=Streptococcus uberis TaxID=1349 RepID=UPI0018A7BEEA
FTRAFTFRCSTSVPQSSTVGVPTSLPFSSTLKPFVGVKLITASDVFVTTTFVSAGTAWPSGTFTGVAVAVKSVKAFGFSSLPSSTPSLSSSWSSLSMMPSPSVYQLSVTGS